MTVIIFSSLIFISCNRSIKGKWSESEKKDFRADLEGLEEFSNYGENKTKLIDCIMSKFEANYSSYSDANNDEKGISKIISECQFEITSNGSIKGKWSESDKQNFRNDMISIEDKSNLSEYKRKLIECFLSKCEANYPSYTEANNDEKGINEISLECTRELK